MVVRHLPTIRPTPRKVTLGDKLHRLALLSEKDLHALEIIVDDLLERRLPQYPRKAGRTDAA